jgi:translation elongation factor EF-1beta
VKPWDDETDMVELEKSVRSIEQDGLVWGASQLVAVGFGIKKLQINLVIGMSRYTNIVMISVTDAEIRFRG